MKDSRLMAVDPSLRCSGWALFHIGRGELTAVGKIKSSDSKLALALRLRELQEKIFSLFRQLKLSKHDVLVCEAPTTMRDPRAAIKVEQVRGIFEAIAREEGMRVPGRLNPRTVQSEIIGLRGRQVSRALVKDAALRVVSRVYGASLLNLGFDTADSELKRHQDIVDAILLGNLGLVRIQSARMAGLELEEIFRETAQARRMRYA